MGFLIKCFGTKITLIGAVIQMNCIIVPFHFGSTTERFSTCVTFGRIHTILGTVIRIIFVKQVTSRYIPDSEVCLVSQLRIIQFSLMKFLPVFDHIKVIRKSHGTNVTLVLFVVHVYSRNMLLQIGCTCK